MMQPIRVALTGGTVSEPVNELLAVVGGTRACARVESSRFVETSGDWGGQVGSRRSGVGHTTRLRSGLCTRLFALSVLSALSAPTALSAQSGIVHDPGLRPTRIHR